jgi:caspase domain-containing protein
MNRFVLSWIAALCGIFLVVLSTDAAWAERKVALVVGNTQYKNPSLVLLNPRNDAEDVADVLRSLDFEVVLTVDANKRDFDLAMTQFARMATGADAALFYYAGHALQYQGRNYLMPTDGELEDEVSLRYQMVLLDDVRAAVERADGVKIIILDACRNNPVVDNLRRKMAGMSRSIEATRGLARIDKALGMVVAYSTAADDVAADGSGRNSPFTGALLRRLKEPGLEIGSMFRRIAADVNEKTNGRQRPETYVSLIGEYYLNQKDKPVWDQIKDSSDASAFRSFIAQFPSSPRASDAQYRLQILERLARQSDPNGTGVESSRTKLAATEQESGERHPVQPPGAEEERARLASIEQQRSRPARPEEPRAKVSVEEQKQASLTIAPLPVTPQAPVSLPPMTQQQACKRDGERLVRLRATQVREEVIRFERELGCEKLRPQLLRLKESIAVDSPGEVTVPSPPQPQEASGTDIGLESPRSQNQPASVQPDEACKRDGERLARLRASPALEQITRFEQELRCTRLRPQIARLRESVGGN